MPITLFCLFMKGDELVTLLEALRHDILQVIGDKVLKTVLSFVQNRKTFQYVADWIETCIILSNQRLLFDRVILGAYFNPCHVYVSTID